MTVDASFVDVPCQRNSREDNTTIKERKTPTDWEKSPRELCQEDLDARWAKKNNEVHYGYKNHVKSDVGTKLLRTYRVSPASEHDSQCFEELVSEGGWSGMDGQRVVRQPGVAGHHFSWWPECGDFRSGRA